MFLKEKHDGQGKFKEMKGILVGDLNTQDRNSYEHLESTTLNIESEFELELASSRKMCTLKLDFVATYMNVVIEDDGTIMMCLNRKLTEMLVEHFPELKEFVSYQ